MAMESPGPTHELPPDDDEAGNSRRFVIAVVAAALGTIGCLVIVAFLLAPDVGGGTGAPSDVPGDQIAVLLYSDFHATLVVSPGRPGTNTIDLNVLSHTGSEPPALDGLTVTVKRAGTPGVPTAYEAEVISKEAGLWAVEAVSFSAPGDWEIGVAARLPEVEPELQTATITITQ
jgi:hypothetical protein